MHGDHVRAHEQVVERQRLLHARRELPGALHGDLRVVAEHLHAEAQRRIRDFDADRAETDDAERAAGQFEADEVLLALLDRDVDGVVITGLRLGERPGLAMLRAARNMPASTSSFTALALAPGALNTGMPFFESASTGMLLVPAPARPTARRMSGIATLCMSAERTRMASGLPISRGDFEAVARQALEALDADVVESLDLESHFYLLRGPYCPARQDGWRYCRPSLEPWDGSSREVPASGASPFARKRGMSPFFRRCVPGSPS